MRLLFALLLVCAAPAVAQTWQAATPVQPEQTAPGRSLPATQQTPAPKPDKQKPEPRPRLAPTAGQTLPVRSPPTARQPSAADFGTQTPASQTRLEQAEQRARDAEQKQFVLQAKSELQDDAYSRLEILIGLFGLALTGIVVFFSFRTEKAAVAAARAGVEDIREKMERQLTKAEELLEKIRGHETVIDGIVRKYGPGEAPESETDRELVAEAAKSGSAKAPRDRSAKDYRAIIINHSAQEEWAEMLTAAQQMHLLFGDDEERGVFALFSEAYALGRLRGPTEELAGYDKLIARYDASLVPTVREEVARALANKVAVLLDLHRSDEALALCDEVIRRYAVSSERVMQEAVARARVVRSELMREGSGDER